MPAQKCRKASFKTEIIFESIVFAKNLFKSIMNKSGKASV